MVVSLTNVIKILNLNYIVVVSQYIVKNISFKLKIKKIIKDLLI